MRCCYICARGTIRRECVYVTCPPHNPRNIFVKTFNHPFIFLQKPFALELIYRRLAVGTYTLGHASSRPNGRKIRGRGTGRRREEKNRKTSHNMPLRTTLCKSLHVNTIISARAKPSERQVIRFDFGREKSQICTYFRQKISAHQSFSRSFSPWHGRKVEQSSSTLLPITVSTIFGL